MRNKVSFKCPYCGTQQTYNLENKQYQMVYCDAEVGGCEKPLVLEQSSYLLHNTTVLPVLPEADRGSYRQEETNREAHNILQFGAFLVEKSIEALKANHFFQYRYHPILREFDVEIYLGGWDSHKEKDFEINDLKASDIEAIKKTMADITEVLEKEVRHE